MEFGFRRWRWLFGAALLSVAFSSWLLIVPPRWWLNLTKPVDLSNPVQAGRALVEKYNCRSCHRIDGWGQALAPDLYGVTRRRDANSIRVWLRNPPGIKPNTPMPNFRLSDSEIEAIVVYLQDLDTR